MNRELLAKRKVLETDMSLFVRYFFRKQFGFPFIFSAYHKKITDTFEKVLSGELQNLLVLMPPRHSKSLLAKLFVAMGFARNASSEFMYICSDVNLALTSSSEIRKIIKSQEFQELWQIEFKSDEDAKKLWKTEKGGSLWAGGVNSPIVGYGAGKMQQILEKCQYNFGGAIVFDDPLKEQERHSILRRNEIIDFFQNTLPSRRNNPKTPVVVIMQPLHKEDLGQWIKKNRPEFELLELPFIDENNNLLFPENFTLEYAEELKKDLGNEMWQAKYLLKPITLGGNLLKTSCFLFYKDLPLLQYRWLEVDTASKIEEKHDFTVLQCWGKSYDGRIYLIDQVRDKVEFSDLKIKFKNFWAKHNDKENYDVRKFGYLKTARIEDKSSGTQLIQESRIDGNIPVSPVPRSRSKYERAVDCCLPKLEAGLIYLPEEAGFIHDFLSEVETFTGQDDSKQTILKMDKKKTFDDQVDCLISACEFGFNEYNAGNSDVVSNFNKLRRKR